MAWQKGYSKAAPGKFGLLIDWETTGSTWGGDSSIDYQGITFGAIVFDTTTFEEVECLYRELKFDETKYKWLDDAQKIHGKTREYLAQHGVPREEALADLIELILKYWTPDSKILMAGHNVSFDNDFTTQLFTDFELGHVFKPHHVSLDTSGISFAVCGEYKSDVVFEVLGGISKRNTHNALDDAKATLAVLRNIRQIFEDNLA